MSLQRRAKVAAALSLLVLAGTYAAVALSSIPREIARRSPEKASLFRPPWFNFFAHYEDGSVLGFEIGSAREELVRRFVTEYGAAGELAAACGREEGAPLLSVAEAYIPANNLERVRELTQHDVVCLHLYARRIVVIFRLVRDRLQKIELAYVRNELVT